jgi:hypothetical protein
MQMIEVLTHGFPSRLAKTIVLLESRCTARRLLSTEQHQG